VTLTAFLYIILVSSILLLIKALCNCKNVLTLLLFAINSRIFEMASSIIYCLFSADQVYIAVQKYKVQVFC